MVASPAFALDPSPSRAHADRGWRPLDPAGSWHVDAAAWSTLDRAGCAVPAQADWTFHDLECGAMGGVPASGRPLVEQQLSQVEKSDLMLVSTAGRAGLDVR